MIIFSERYDSAKYPFLAVAKEYIRKLGYDINEFDENVYIIEKSIKRVWLALNRELPRALGEPEEEIISFLLSLLILNRIGIKSASKRFALAEAERIEYFLEQDLKHENEAKRNIILQYIFKDTLGLDVIYDGRYKIRVVDYLKRATNLHDPYWRLINKDVYDGYVHLDLHDIVRLIREEIALLIYERIERISVKDIPDSIESRIEVLRRSIISDKRFRPFTYIENRRYPPCIDNILSILKNGENPPHTARFLLATYMLAIGKSVDEVCSLFVHAPDYNEKITRYQVEFLAGKRGKSYNCPNCDKIASMNLCYKNEECDDIRSPLQFGRRKDE